MNRAMEAGGYAIGLVILAAAWLLLVPAGTVHQPTEPDGFATIAAVLAVSVAIVLRSRPDVWARLQAPFLAMVLGFMPLVYLAAAVIAGTVADVVVEGVGLVIFVGLAVLGCWRGTWIIVAGIVAHGLLWDGWRHGRAAYIDDWYPLGCLAFDVGFGLMAFGYLWSRGRLSAASPQPSANQTDRGRM